MIKPTEQILDSVSRGEKRSRTRPDGEVRSRWRWTEPTVWTNRMLTALENGVQGGKWPRLIDKAYSDGNLFSAYVQVAGDGGGLQGRIT